MQYLYNLKEVYIIDINVKLLIANISKVRRYDFHMQRYFL